MSEPLSLAAWDFVMQCYDSEDGKLRVRMAAAARVVLQGHHVPGAQHKAEDVVQEAFLAFAQIVDAKGKGHIKNPEAYLWVVARRKVKKLVEDEYPERICGDFSAVEPQLTRVRHLVEKQVRHVVDPEEQLVRNEDVTLVRDFVRSRSALARDTLVLYDKGLTTKQIADKQGRSAEAVEQQRRRERTNFHVQKTQRLNEAGGH
ncbi:RNA polymerase sigma factor (sigma-70 family) [Streptomyces sp. SAI-208]|uniref:sigma-70 family RNA polymerase sigma factor n=1 Tax=Streptomyces sp. SAI-208 TaxID=2940550 RepID=UPI00247602F5|nr:sigma-70 family RNA polymerase sigma factor [Streptomyces sp. SAI-208]MDH6604467.1 RNA polymerase sigma factor (sigma-70 family) [Streptomyces sp. SAI-208]